MSDQQHTVECQRTYQVSPDSLWRTVGDFYSAWHPLMETCEQESGTAIRRFNMPNDSTVYREQLLYKSHSDHSFCYQLLEGIEDINRYRAGVKIERCEEGAILTWWADIDIDADADEARAEEVAKGTQYVLEAGLDYLSEFLESRSVETILVQGSVSLALSFADGSESSSDSLCLFLHGIGGNRSNWRDQLNAVSEIMPCAAMDLRGYGNSALGDSQSTIDDYCSDIIAVADHFNCKKLILVGLSYGAWIATHFALHYSDRLAGLVVCGGCTGMSEAPEAVRQNFLKTRLEPMDAGQVPADFADNVVAMISGPNASEANRNAMHQSMSSIPVETYRDALHCFTHPPGQHDFSALTCPVLLMTGEHDQLAPPQEINTVALRMLNAERPAKAPLPNIQFEVIEGAGHIANIEQPAKFNHHLSAFLRSLPAE